MKSRKYYISGIRAVAFVLAMTCFFGCKSKDSFVLNPDRVDETRSAIRSSVEDPARCDAMLAIVNAMEGEVTAAGSEVKELRQQIVEANRNYDTTREELEQLYADLGVQAERLATSVKVHSLQLREQCTESEWNRITSHKTKAFEFNY